MFRELVNLLTDMSSDSYDGIAVFPIDDEQVKSKINQLADQGIIIITFNSKIEGIHDLCFLGQDHVQGGAAAAGFSFDFPAISKARPTPLIPPPVI